MEGNVSFHIIETYPLLEPDRELLSREPVFDGLAELFQANLALDICCHFRHGALDVEEIGLCCKLSTHILLVGLRGQNLFHFLQAIALRLEHVTSGLE